MKKNKRFVSIKKKITLSTLIPIVISHLLINGVLFSILSNAVNETAQAKFSHITEKYAASFNSYINNAVNYLSIIVSTVERQVATGNTDREALQQTVHYIFDSYGLLDGSSVYFEPNQYDGLDADYIATAYGTAATGRICYYFYKSEGQTAYLPEAFENDLEFTLPHYTDAKTTNGPIYTEPVVYTVDGREIAMFTLTYPIQDPGGAFIGAVTVDIFLADLYDQLQNERIYDTGYIILANDRDQIIYSPRFDDVGNTRESVGLHYALPSRGEVAVYENARSLLNGKKTLLTIAPIYIPQLDSCFYISVSAPVSEINAGGYRVITAFILMNLLISIIIVTLQFLLVGKISTPITEITDNVNKIAKGSYGARIQGDYNDEFAVVKDSVNLMADSIEAYIKEAKDSLSILENILNGLDAFIYVTMPDTGEILFINRSMREHYKIEGSGVGQLCYKVLQNGLDQKCHFCPSYKLDKNPDKVVVWEEHNAATSRDYRKTDRYIDWLGGVKVHLQHSVDITEIKQFLDDKLKAEAAAQAKNDFLARMSHEIRTPMNAVMGMCELILRKQLPPDVYENAVGIKNAGANLLSIINDILDFSKIESGRMEIIETDYTLASLINDVTGIIRIRLMEKPIQFAAYIDANVPASLFGDVIRIRQILLNLLSNAVKYTPEGVITLTLSGTVNGDTVDLVFDVADTGQGIKASDIEKLFGEFTRVDMTINKSIEGTGLGLAITRSLSRAMGGDVTVKSEYGQGSVFTFSLPQRFHHYEPFAAVTNPADKGVLLYEPRPVYRDAVVYTLEQLAVPCLCVDSIPQLFENLQAYHYVFVASFLCGSVQPAVNRLAQPPCLTLMADITETMAVKDVRILSLPAHPLSVANILNDLPTDPDEMPVTGASFSAPDVKVLIVDDIVANLKVAEGLMSPYEMQLTTCMNGREAVQLVAENHFDLVFMDHMMPEMDGLEATARIRAMEGAYYRELPIIALTANAVSGIREMFVQNGMNDFLAKPIETIKLDALLEKWIPKAKRKKAKAPEVPEAQNTFVEQLRVVPTLDVNKALSMVGGSTSTYERIVRLSVRLLPDNMAKLDSHITTDLDSYTIEVHGIKGVLNNIGAYGLGEMAFALETAAKAGDADTCHVLHGPFKAALLDFHKSVIGLVDGDAQGKPPGDFNRLREALPDLEEAADFFNSVSALSILNPLDAYTFGVADPLLADLSQAFERFDFDTALSLINALRDELDALA